MAGRSRTVKPSSDARQCFEKASSLAAVAVAMEFPEQTLLNSAIL